MLSPLYPHPSDGPHTGTIQEKLAGPSNYRAWRRDMEIVLASERKLGFVTGLVQTDPEDVEGKINGILAIAWKYKLNKAVYDLRQKEQSVTEYYTSMKSLWDELDAMSNLPPITLMTPEVQAFVNALNKQREEGRLFQFLNGLDNNYGSKRSHILMFSPLPSVEEACASDKGRGSNIDEENQEGQEGETTSNASIKGCERSKNDTVEETQCEPENVSSKDQMTSGLVEENITVNLRRSSRETKTPA
ncbi:hypothetical protein RDABS01_033184 [Bienertia sinuspersici]